MPIDDYLDIMPTVKAKCEIEAWSAVDGKFYGYPFISGKDFAWTTFLVRSDYMKALGYEESYFQNWTLGDFYRICKEIKTKDPDDNGKDDTYGISMNKSMAPLLAMTPFGLKHADWELDAAGKVMPIHEHPSFRPGLEFWRKLWDEGLLDPEFMLNGRQELEEEREKDNFAKLGWAHTLAWGNVTWPAAERYVPQMEPNREKVLDSIRLATENLIYNLTPTKTPEEIELGEVVQEIYNQYMMDMITSKIGIDEGLAKLKKEWRANDGEKILASVQKFYDSLQKQKLDCQRYQTMPAAMFAAGIFSRGARQPPWHCRTSSTSSVTIWDVTWAATAGSS